MTSKRIELIMNDLKMNKNQFSKALGLTNNVTIGRIINEGRTPSYEILEKIIQTFSNINANWLITGIGSMYNDENFIQSKSNSLKQEITINGQEGNQEQMLKAFAWFVFSDYKSKFNTDIKFDSFTQLAQVFKLTSQVCEQIQEALEWEITHNLLQDMKSSLNEGVTESVIPETIKNIIDKYDSIYNDFMFESDIMNRLIEITNKHQTTLLEIIKSAGIDDMKEK